MLQTIPIPDSIEEITAVYLTKVLREKSVIDGETAVHTLTKTRIGEDEGFTGGTLLRCQLTYTSSVESAPHSLIAKLYSTTERASGLLQIASTNSIKVSAHLAKVQIMKIRRKIMSNKVRIGIIGTSGWTEFMFLTSFNSHPAAEIVAICGRNRERGEALAEKHGIPQVFTDYRALIKEAGVDAVVIASPDDLHFPMAMAALDAGLHVLCEKPLANNSEQAKEMVEKANAMGVKHMVLYTWRWLPVFQYLKYLVDDGFIGRCYHANFRFLGGFGRSGEYTWRQDGQRTNGMVADLGSHMIDFAHWLVGDISKVSASLGHYVVLSSANDRPLIPANDSAYVMLQFKNQAQGMIQTSAVTHQAARTFEICMELYGEVGSLEVEFLALGANAGTKIRGVRDDEDEFTLMEIPERFYGDADPANPFDVFVKHSVGPRLFVDSILEDRMPTPNFHDALKAQEVIDAALASHQSEVWVTLP